MLKNILDWFFTPTSHDGMVKFVRTEYHEEVKHLSNEDAVAFYNHTIKRL